MEDESRSTVWRHALGLRPERVGQEPGEDCDECANRVDCGIAQELDRQHIPDDSNDTFFHVRFEI
jgi:hypothetical protein